MNTPTPTHRPTRAPGRAWPLLLATLGLALAAGLSQPVLAAGPGGPGGHGMMGHAGGHGGHGGHGMMGHGMGMMGGRLLESVGATEQQRQQIQAIMAAAHKDLQAQREGGKALHEQMRAAFTATTVDARVVEALRQQMLARHDAASKRMSQAMIDAAAVLSPEQRQKLADKMAQRKALAERHRAERRALN